ILEITGDWKTSGAGPTTHEVISPTAAKAGANSKLLLRHGAFLSFAKVSFTEEEAASVGRENSMNVPEAAIPAAPIRVTSPGLTVYKGGAVTPRLYLIKQHLGSLEVNRQALDLSVSYTPSPRLQLEIEAPFLRTAYDNGITSGSGFGIGNFTGWA